MKKAIVITTINKYDLTSIEHFKKYDYMIL